MRLHRLEWQPLAALFLAAAIAWGFVELADEVLEGETKAVDTALLLLLRTPGAAADPLGPRWLEDMARDLTALGSVGVLVLWMLAALGYLVLAGKRHAALAVLVAVTGGQVLSTLLKLGFDRPRPDLVPHAVEVSTASFPSGHSMMAAVTYLTLGVLLARVERQWRIKVYYLGLAAFLTALVGITRVYLGVHWPSDVLGGWAVGAAWATVCAVAMERLQRRGAVEAPL